jgi:hypothetical protein
MAPFWLSRLLPFAPSTQEYLGLNTWNLFVQSNFLKKERLKALHGLANPVLSMPNLKDLQT